MNGKQRLLESEIAKLMKIQLVELDEYGHIKRNVTDNNFDDLDQDLFEAAVHEVQQTSITMLRHEAAQYRQMFCFKLAPDVIVCGLGFPNMDEQQLRLCALCLYIGLLGRPPLIIPEVISVTAQAIQIEPVHILIQAVAKENWVVLIGFVKEHFGKVTPAHQRLIGLTLIAGLFVGRQLTVKGRLVHFTEIVSQWWQAVRNDQLDAVTLGRQLIAAFERREANGSHPSGDQLVNQIMADVNAHLETRLLVTDVAKRLHLSPDYVTRHFHEQTGWTLKRYSQMRKIARAKVLLPDNSVSDVCYQLHFGDQSHFAKVFKQQTGMTPHQYQREYQDEQQ
ncbi:MAG TPA: hypothetical protein DCW31_00970 [Lactobacillus sp.]|nr:hypothetical protein [Lactobacillus sp.]